MMWRELRGVLLLLHHAIAKERWIEVVGRLLLRRHTDSLHLFSVIEEEEPVSFLSRDGRERERKVG